MFSWLLPKKHPKSRRHAASQADSSDLAREESTRPAAGHGDRPAHRPKSRPHDDRDPHQLQHSAEGNSLPGKGNTRRLERTAHREQLYNVVRECMANAGVVSACYKFKVLSLDSRGQSFMVMIDLSREYAGEATRLSEIEAMIAQAAKHRFGIVVSAAYWRINDHVAVGLNVRPHAAAPAQPASRPTPLSSSPAELEPTREAHAASAPRHEPLQPAEIAAFRQALADGHAGSARAKSASPERAKSQNYTLLTGFEDTETADGKRYPNVLSETQPGELR